MAERKHKWIKGAIKHPGAFKAAAERAGKSTSEFAAEHAHDSGTLGKRARLAQTLMKMHHNEGGMVNEAGLVRRERAERMFGPKKVTRHG